jgi:ABC-type branched-subunit amino acid transport system ATPase component/ABC-type branched-subunit amino acid transport system permease subunit
MAVATKPATKAGEFHLEVPRPSWHIALVFVAFAVAAPLLGRALPGPLNGYHTLILCFGVTYAMAALPLNLLMGYAGQISLGHAAFLGVGAYASGIIAGRLGLPFVLGLLVAMAAGALAALVIGLPALRIRGLYLALVTLGFGLAMYSLIFRLRAVTGGYAGIAVPRPKAWTFEFSNNADLLAVVIVLFGVVWLADRNLMRTKVGRAFLALREEEDVAAAFGIDVPRYKIYAFVLYGAFAGAAGSVLGHVIGFAQQESFTFDFSLIFVVIVLIGGLRSRPGIALSAFFLGASPRLFGFLHDWVLLVGPALVLFTLVRHPRGLGGAITEIQQALRGKRSKVAPEEDEDAAAFHLALPRPVQTDVTDVDLPLVVSDVTVRFGGLVAVDGVSLDVQHNRITGLIGPNGAGKTTLFNAVSGLVAMQEGRIVINGVDATKLPAHRRAATGMGRTFQHIGLVKDLSVTENLLLAQHRLASYDPFSALGFLPYVARGERKLRERAAETLHVLQFERYADAQLNELSHGQQRIVEIAAASLTSPGLLLLDEPSAGMSPAAAEALAERLIQIRDEIGQTIFLIEHHLPLVMATCNRVHVMDSGRLLTTGTPAAIRSNPDVVTAYLGGHAR